MMAFCSSSLFRQIDAGKKHGTQSAVPHYDSVVPDPAISSIAESRYLILAKLSI